MQDTPKAVWSIPYVSLAAFFAILKQNFIAYRFSKVSDCIFEIHQLWQSGFSRVYSNFYCSCSFEPEIQKIGQSSHKMYSNKILNFQESTTILNAHTKKVWKLIVCTSYKQNTIEKWKKILYPPLPQKRLSQKSLTAIAAKVYNALFLNCIQLEVKKILWKNQNSFWKYRSTTSQILTIC